MRIHRLEIQAFGPFAGLEVIDFDELSSQGLFLLNGPTGAGKTSVLDAVCFALYGAVPGARQEAKRLRSDHAGVGVAPRVCCEFSVGSRRFEVTRSPQWERPAKRSGGKATATEQARTLLRERVDGQWVDKSARNDEASMEIISVLGLNRQQFTRVVMLPQGDFAAFLRANAEDRRELLQQLFDTGRFRSVENLLGEDLARVRSEADEALAAIAVMEQRLQDDAASSLPAPPADDDGEAPAWTGLTGAALVEALHRCQQDELGRSRGELGILTTAAEAAHEHFELLRERAVRHESLAAFRAAVALQQDRESQVQRHRGELAAAADAEKIAPLLLRLERSGALTEAAAAAVRDYRTTVLNSDQAVAYLGDPGRREGLDTGELEAAISRLDGDLGLLRAALPREGRLQDLRQGLQRLEATKTTLTGKQAELASSEAELRLLQEELTAEIEQHRGTSRDAGLLAEQCAAAEKTLLAIDAHAAAEADAAVLRDRAAEAKAHWLTLKEQWLNLLRKRLEQAAAELAAGLQDDEPCPVCGSEKHPRPAQAQQDGLVTKEQEEAAQAGQYDAENAATEAAARLADAETRLSVLRGQGGDQDRAAAAAALGQLQARAGAARAAAGKLAEAEQRLDDAKAQAAVTATELSAAAVRLGETAAQLVSVRDELDREESGLAELRAGHPDLADRLAVLGGFRSSVSELLAAVRQENAARNEQAAAAEHWAAALAASPFETEQEFRSAALDPREAEARRAAVEEFVVSAAKTEALGESPAVVLAAGEAARGISAPTPGELEAAEAEARDRRTSSDRARVAVELAERFGDRLEALGARLAAAVAAAEPLLRRYQLVKELSELTRGLGENQKRMTLTTYVLAARLEAVAAAASDRLSVMTDGRYVLVHDDSRSGNRKSGLGLHVVDEWTGQQRDTSTLSGGESFMASLALALGLADVVQQEAGGIDIETLFVDEGFGSLDEQTLEQVMDALEGLRDGGRVVGLVSHVPEMKQRIGTQLRVLKGRQGSTLSVSLGLPELSEAV